MPKARLLIIAAVVGVLSGLAATLLEWGVQEAISLFIGRFIHVGGSDVLRFHWALLVLPTAAGLFSGLVSLLTDPKLSHGTEAVVRAFHHGGGVLSLKDSAIKGTAAVAVIGCGGSAGPEGPIAAIGAAIGSALGIRLSLRERRILLLAGCGGGVGAIFHCPLGGALFATTILYSDLDIEADALLLSLIASVVSFATFKAFWGYETPLLRGTDALGFRVGDLAAYAVLAILCAAGAALFRCSYDGVRRWRRLLPRWLAPALGGLLVGAVALAVPQVMDARYVFIQGWLDGSLLRGDSAWSSWVMLLAIISAAKCVATGLTVGSGNAGGLLGPTVFIGGAVGALTGAVLEAVFPGLVPEDLRRALVPAGMAGLLAASMRVPLAAIVMVTEMTASYGLIVPFMLVSGLAYFLGRRWGINPEQVGERTASPAHAGEALVTLLESARAGDFADKAWPFVVDPLCSRGELASRLPSGTRPTFAVVENGRLRGVLSARDLAEGTGQTAGTLMTRDPIVIHSEESLYEALDIFLEHRLDVLPVVDEGAFVGMLTRRVILKALHDGVTRERQHLLREHPGITALAQEHELEGLLAGLPDSRRGIVQRLPAPPQAVGRSLREVDFRSRFGAQVIAVLTRGGEVLAPPDPVRPLQSDDVLIVLAAR